MKTRRFTLAGKLLVAFAMRSVLNHEVVYVLLQTVVESLMRKQQILNLAEVIQPTLQNDVEVEVEHCNLDFDFDWSGAWVLRNRN